MRVVYTALLGGSDTLKAAPIDAADLCVCFTDEPKQDPKGWDLRPWRVITGHRRDAWRLRCRPDLLFPLAERTLWLDASFSSVDVAALFEEADSANVAGFQHHDRKSCYAEGQELIDIGQSLHGEVTSQLKQYARDGFAPEALTSAGVLVRGIGAIRFNLQWEYEIACHLGDNTQLSIDYAAWRSGLQIHHLRGTYPDNPYVVYDAEDHHAHRRPYR